MKDKTYFPAFLDLDSQPCLVVGGGVIAQRKVETLLECGALVTVVSLTLTTRLQELQAAGRLRVCNRGYRAGDETGMRVVIAATDDPHVNHQVFIDAQNRGIPVNVVDDPQYCSFIVPAQARRGNIQIAVSTGGAAPAIAARIRDELAASVGDEYETLISELSALRDRIRALDTESKHRFWKCIRELSLTPFRGRAMELKEAIDRILRDAGSEGRKVQEQRE